MTSREVHSRDARWFARGSGDAEPLGSQKHHSADTPSASPRQGATGARPRGYDSPSGDREWGDHRPADRAETVRRADARDQDQGRGMTSRGVYRHDAWSLYGTSRSQSEHLRNDGHARQNTSGGQSYHNAYGSALDRSMTTASGRGFFFDSHGGLLGRAAPNAEGGRIDSDSQGSYSGRSQGPIFDRHDVAIPGGGFSSR